MDTVATLEIVRPLGFVDRMRVVVARIRRKPIPRPESRKMREMRASGLVHRIVQVPTFNGWDTACGIKRNLPQGGEYWIIGAPEKLAPGQHLCVACADTVQDAR